MKPWGRKASVGKMGTLVSQTYAGAGGVALPNSGLHTQRFLKYSSIGMAVLGALAAAYLGIRALGAPLPPQQAKEETKQEQQYVPDTVNQQQENISKDENVEILRMTLPSNLSRIREYDPNLADLVESALGADGYDRLELYMIPVIEQVAGIASSRNASTVIEDLKLTLQTQSYRSTTINIGDRNLEVIVLASDPARAPFYFDTLQRIIPKVEAFIGLKYADNLIVIHDQHKPVGSSMALTSGITTWYPEKPSNVKPFEKDLAHEYDHLVTKQLNMPVWLFEGKANITGYAVINEGKLPEWEGALPLNDGEKVSVLYARRSDLFNIGEEKLSVPPELRDATYADKLIQKGRAGARLTVFGEITFFDLLRLGGPAYVETLIQTVNSLSRTSFVSTEVFIKKAVEIAPKDLKPSVITVLDQRFYGNKPADMYGE